MIEVKETFVNQANHTIFGENDWYESYCDTRAEQFRACQLEYGRCVSKMYRDDDKFAPLPVGWVFERKEKYEDCDDHYIREVWVEVRVR